MLFVNSAIFVSVIAIYTNNGHRSALTTVRQWSLPAKALASAETVSDLLLPAKTIVHDKWLPAESVRMILLPAKTLKEAQSYSLSRKPFLQIVDFKGSKRLRTIAVEATNDGLSWQEAKIGRPVYTLCYLGFLHWMECAFHTET